MRTIKVRKGEEFKDLPGPENPNCNSSKKPSDCPASITRSNSEITS
jgi:hypothetical protein